MKREENHAQMLPVIGSSCGCAFLCRFPCASPHPVSSCPTMNLCGFYYRTVRVCLKMLTHIHFQKSDLIPHDFSAGEVYLV